MTPREHYRAARQQAFDARMAALRATQIGDGRAAIRLTKEAQHADRQAESWLERLEDQAPENPVAYTVTLGATTHLPERYAGLWNALKAAEDLGAQAWPIFVYDQMGMVAAVGTDSCVQIYDRALRRAVLRQPGFTRLRIL